MKSLASSQRDVYKRKARLKHCERLTEIKLYLPFKVQDPPPPPMVFASKTFRLARSFVNRRLVVVVGGGVGLQKKYFEL